MHRIIAVAQIQRDILLLLLDVEASRTAQVDGGRQVQIDAAQATGSLAEALGLRRGRSRLDLRQIPREQGLCGARAWGAYVRVYVRAMYARAREIRDATREKLGTEKSERNESRADRKLNGSRISTRFTARVASRHRNFFRGSLTATAERRTAGPATPGARRRSRAPFACRNNGRPDN